MEPEDDEIVIRGVEERTDSAKITKPKAAGSRSKSLPQFSFRGFVDNVDRQKKIEEERLRAEAEERKERREMWTTPGKQPLAEPPMMDWDFIFRRRLKSDAQYAALFPRKPDKIAIQKNLDFEVEALIQYRDWAESMERDVDTPPSRRRFFSELGNELFGDYREVAAEGQAHHNEADTVAKFEYRFLDEKGGISNMERLLKDGAEIFYSWRPTITEKYGYLWPSDFKLNALETWEARWTFPQW